MTNQWFYRDGNLWNGQALTFKQINASTAQITNKRSCWRCGGLGGADQWKFTGYTCYRCNGDGNDPVDGKYKLYTAEKLAQLQEAQAKRDHKKMTAAEAKRIEARQAALKARKVNADELGMLIALAWPLRKEISFFNDIIKTVLKLGKVSDKQMQAVLKIVDNRRKRKESEYVGQVKERITTELKLIDQKYLGYKRGYDFQDTPSFLTIFEDENGNQIKTFGKVPTEFISHEYDREIDDYVTTYNKDSFVKVMFTVKDHNEYRGEKSTLIIRLKVIK